MSYLRCMQALVIMFVVFLVGCEGAETPTGTIDDPTGPNDKPIDDVNFISIYHFDEEQGLKVTNSVNNQADGTINGALWGAGKNSAAGIEFVPSQVPSSHIHFNACCDPDVETTAPERPVRFDNGLLSIAFWIRPNQSIAVGIYPIFGGSYDGLQSFRVRTNNGKVEFLLYLHGSTNPITLASATSLANDRWDHVAIVYNAVDAKIYINGVNDNELVITLPVMDIVNNYFLGGIPGNLSAGSGNRSIPANIDEFYLANDELTEDHVATLFEDFRL